MTAAERAEVIAERDDTIESLHRMVHNQLAIRQGYMRLDENPLLDFQIQACHRHIDRLNDLLGSETADHGSTLDRSRAVVGRREQV